MSGYGFSKGARAEIEEAIAYYNHQKAGLGKEFSAEVDAGIDQVLAHPHRWPILIGNKRRYRLKRFPYGLVYQIGRECIFFLAVMHLKRRPGYWRGRQAEFRS